MIFLFFLHIILFTLIPETAKKLLGGIYMVKRIVGILLLFGWIMSSPLFASGYMVPEQGSAAMTTGNATAARGQDPSANWFNPASLTQLRGTQAMFGMTYLNITPQYIGQAPGFQSKDSKVEEAFVPHFYASHQIHPNIFVGFGLNVPFGLVQDWGEWWQGRRIITRATLKAIVMNPNIAFSLPEKLQRRMGGLKISYGIGFGLGFGKFTLGQRVDQSFVGASDGYVKITGGSTKDIGDFENDVLGLNLNTGLLLEWKNLSFGVSYRSRMGFHVDHSKAASGDFYGIDPALQGAGIVDQKVNTRLFTPPIVMLGFAYKFKKFEIEFDAWWTDWSVFGTLPLDFQGAAPDKVIHEEWNGVWSFRGGVKYYIMGEPVMKHRPQIAADQNCGKCGKKVAATDPKCPHCGAEFEGGTPNQGSSKRFIPKKQLYVAFGGFYDNGAAPNHTFSPTIPDSDRYGFTFGFGVKYGNFGADLAFMVLFADDRIKNNLEGATSGSLADPFTANGEYKVEALLVGISLHFSF